MASGSASASTSPSDAAAAATYSLRVKTLDSNNHAFTSLASDMKVSALKARISPTVGIAAERQRLIYCGRVMQDDKTLKDYNVDGKVIHLVAKPPPSQANNNGGVDRLAASEARAARSRGPSPAGRRTAHAHHQIHFAHHHHHHNQAVGGAGGSTGAAGTQGIVGQSSPQVRLNVSRDMLRRARVLLDQLDNVAAGRPAGTGTGGDSAATTSTSSSSSSTTTQTSSGSGDPSSSTTSTRSTTTTSSSTTTQRNPPTSLGPQLGPGTFPRTVRMAGLPFNMAQAIQQGMASALGGAGATGVASAGSADGGSQPAQISMSFRMDSNGQFVPTGSPRIARPRSQQAGSARTSSPSSAGGGSAAAAGASARSSSSSNSSSIAGSPSARATVQVEYPPASEMAAVMNEYQEVNARLTTHWTRLTAILQDDPELAGEAAITEHQELFDRVTQTMHAMSHAQHALSDMMVSFSRPAPRVLRARPFVIQSMVQSIERRVPIVLATNVGQNAATAPNSNRTASNSRSRSSTPAAAASAAPTSTAASAPAAASSGTATPSAPPSAPTMQMPMDIGEQVAAAAMAAMAAATDGSPGGDIQMSMTPIMVGIEMGPDMVIPAAGRSGAAATGGTGGSSSNSSSDQAAAGTTATSSAPTNPEATSSASNASNGQTQNSRARGNTQTQPTTSTRTRSSPQVHYAPFATTAGSPLGPSGIGYGSMHSFDPFLQCNSHHIPGSNVAAAVQRHRMRHPAGLQPNRPRSASVPPRRQQQQQQQQPGAPGASASASSTPPSPSGRGSVRASSSDDIQVASGPISAGSLIYGTDIGVQNQLMAAAVDSAMGGLLDQLGQQRQQQGGASADENNVMNMVQGVLGQVMGSLGGNEGAESPTVSQFLSSLPDYNYVEGDSLLTDLLMTLAQSLTFRDLMELVQGTFSNMAQLQQPLQTFFLRRVLEQRGESSDPSQQASQVTSGQVESAVVRLADNLFPELEAVARVANVREGTDFAETLHNYFVQSLPPIFLGVMSHSPTIFEETLLPRLRVMVATLTSLCRLCFTDELVSLERVVQDRLALISADVGPVVQQWTMSSAIGHLRNYVAGSEASEADCEGYIVSTVDSPARREARKARKEAESTSSSSSTTTTTSAGSATPSPQQQQVEEEGEVALPMPEASQDESGTAVTTDEETFTTPRSSPELMETEQEPAAVTPPSASSPKADVEEKSAAAAAAAAATITVPPPIVESELSFPSSLMPPPAPLGGVQLGQPNWQRRVPPSWVPVINRDGQQTARSSPGQQQQDPFSDAYLSTQPAKRRKLASEAKPDSGDLQQAVTQSLQEAIRSTGARPSTSLDEAARETAGDAAVLAAVQRETMATVRKKAEKNPDLNNAGRFPNTKSLLERKD